MKRIVGACLSQFHGDEDNFELLVAYSDCREIGNVVSKAVAQTIAKDMADQLGLSDVVQEMLEALREAYSTLTSNDALDLSPIIGSDNPHEHAAGLVAAAIARAEGRS